MVPRQPWFERRFTFDLPVAAAPGLLERLRGTPARLTDRLSGVPAARLTRQVQGRWSILENVGHLGDLEELWATRVDDLATGRDTLRAADLENRRTHEAHHNSRTLDELVARLRAPRRELVRQLEAADEADWLRSALHPRLRERMRLLDLAFFIAEHDDHHLATISDLLRRPD
ncbi:MAG: DinB family protein [Gemmatimonadetes bacterium]|nr:DinB family protein [Gemmatimonadota bacterium]